MKRNGRLCILLLCTGILSLCRVSPAEEHGYSARDGSTFQRIRPPHPRITEEERYRHTVLNPEGAVLSAEEKEIIHLTNLWRIQNRKAPLVVKKALMDQARSKSRNMAAQNNMSHQVEPRLQYGAENIAMGYRDAAAVFEGWKNSPGHNANMLNADLHYFGVGIAQGSAPYYTQVFGF